MQIWPFEKDSKHSKVIQCILIQIITIQKRFEAFKCKFETFERDFKPSNADSNHLKGIQSIQMQIVNIRKAFETFKCKFIYIRRQGQSSQ